MKLKRIIYNEDGFTLQELLVTLIIASLVVGFSLSLVQFANRLFISWQRKLEVRQAVATTLHIIAQDVRHSTRVNKTTDSTFVVVKPGNVKRNYYFNGKSVLRDSFAVWGDKRVLVSVNVSSNEDSGHTCKIVITGNSTRQRNTRETTTTLLPSKRTVFEKGLLKTE